MSRLGVLLLAIAGSSALAFTLRTVGALEAAELYAYDLLVQNSSQPVPAPGVVVVEAREQDLRDLGHWPISDRVLAQALEGLRSSGAVAIGIDWYRNLGVPPGEVRFEQVLREDPRIIGVSLFGDARSPGVPGPRVLEEAGRVGFNDFPTDDVDSAVRRGLLYQDDGANAIETSFALQLALRAMHAEDLRAAPDPQAPEWLRLGPTTVPPLPTRLGGYEEIDAGGYQILIDYAHDHFRTFSFTQLLKGEIGADALHDSVVLIGSNAESLPDLSNTPLGPRVGLVIHAHVVDQLLRYARGVSVPIRWPPEWAVALLLVMTAALGCLVASGFGPSRYDTGVRVAVGLATLLVFPAATFLAFRSGWWIPSVAPTMAALAGAGATAFLIASRERAERVLVMGLFERHVSQAVASEVWTRRSEFMHGGRPRPRRLEATVMFIDMVGFTAKTEQLEPALLMDWTNRFMDRMAEEVRRAGGVVDDYFGDGLKAVFGVPIPSTTAESIASDARRAIECAHAMREALEELNREYRESGMPEVAMRMGLYSGAVVAGSLGSSDRLKYTVMGDVVVAAMRLESTRDVAHDFESERCRILIGARTHELTGSGTLVGKIRLAGLSEPFEVFRVTPAGAARGDV